MSVDATRSTWKISNDLITPTSKFILFALADRAGETNECWPSIARLVADTGYDRKTIMIHLDELSERGFIKIYKKKIGPLKRGNLYKLLYVESRESEPMLPGPNIGICKKQREMTIGPNIGTCEQSKQDTGPNIGTCTGTNIGTKNLSVEPNTKIICSSGDEQVQISNEMLKKNKDDEQWESFEGFMKFYPRRVSKKRAWEAYKKIHVTDEWIAQVKADIIGKFQSKEWSLDNMSKIPHPDTYLKNERWKDEQLRNSKLIPKKNPHHSQETARPQPPFVRSINGELVFSNH